MKHRLITPSQLALFRRSPVIGAWWEELEAQNLFQGERPAVTSLDQRLFDSGLEHGRVLIERLEAQGHAWRSCRAVDGLPRCRAQSGPHQSSWGLRLMLSGWR